MNRKPQIIYKLTRIRAISFQIIQPQQNHKKKKHNRNQTYARRHMIPAVSFTLITFFFLLRDCPNVRPDLCHHESAIVRERNTTVLQTVVLILRPEKHVDLRPFMIRSPVLHGTSPVWSGCKTPSHIWSLPVGGGLELEAQI